MMRKKPPRQIPSAEDWIVEAVRACAQVQDDDAQETTPPDTLESRWSQFAVSALDARIYCYVVLIFGLSIYVIEVPWIENICR